MEYREIAGRKVSAVGMGTYYGPPFIARTLLLRSQRNREAKVAALKKGLELGINLIDTAEVYQTEDMVAEAIKGWNREELFIATKVSPRHLHTDSLLRAAQRSIERLQCRYIDLYQIHWPSRTTPIRETMKAMERLVEEGKIRHIGVSNFNLAEMIEAQEALAKSRVVSNQVPYNLKDRRIEGDLLPHCGQHGIAILAYFPLASGVLTKPAPKLAAAMREVSEAHGGKTPAQISLNWLLSKGKNIFPIPRASRPERVVEDSGSVGWNLSAEEISGLEAAV